MRIVIHIYDTHALEEYVYEAYPLPDERATATLKLRSDRFRLRTDHVINLTISNYGISLSGDDSDVYYQYPDNKIKCENIISENAGLVLVTGDREVLRMDVYFSHSEGMRFYDVESEDIITVGNSPKRTVGLIDNRCVSDLSLMIKRKEGGGILNVKAEEGCYLNGTYIGQMNTASLDYGDIIMTGGVRLLWLDECMGFEALYSDVPSVIRLSECDLPCVVDSSSDEIFTSSVRNLIVPDDSVVELDPPPPAPSIRHQPIYLAVGPSLTMAVPMCLGCGLYIYASSRAGVAGSAMYMYTGLVTAIASAILGTVWAVANVRQIRRQEESDAKLRIKAYTEYISECSRLIEDKYRYNRNALLRNGPCIRELLQGNPGNFVLNRRAGDADLFKYRLGTGKLKFEVDIKAPKEKFMPVPDELALLPHKLKNKYRELNDVPICTDLGKDRIQGFISRSSQELERLFINISLQIAATTGPELIRMVFLFSDNTISRDTIRSMRWLPHAVGDDEHYVCIGRDRVDEFLCRLDRIIKDHEHMMIRWIIFTDDHKRIPSSIISREDVILMIFAKEYRQLPGECRCIIQNDGAYRGMLMPGSEELRKDINFDHISAREADIYARRIAGICRYIKPAARQVPALVTLPMLYDKGMITTKDIAAGWNENNTWNSIRAPIGMAEDSRVVSLDIHEKAHGPHGLVAGMTGSGKSELLQTMILSFALRYPPWEIGFFLIDYKGGGMASMFEGLPHLIGSISNLSGNITDRALLSIRSENERRQRLFLDAGVNSIRDYGRLFSTGKVNEPLPHILIIIDEFAELKRDQPEFMKELISVAQVGRSLGVHLILATQKPAGTVDDNIFSNSRFRICLRVQDRQDSNDMLHRPDAAYIKEPGRAYLQVGNDELFEEFQSGYTMEPYNGEKEGASLYLLDINGRRIDVADRPLKSEGEDTHFSVLMNVLKDCFAGAEKIPVQKLWLPELDSIMIIDNETMMSSGEESGVIIGRYDDPENRLQGFIRIDILKTGHIAICGSALSGKSTFLQTLIMSWLKCQDIINTAIYIIDYSNGMLSCFKESHAVGAYINEEHSDRLGNLFCMLKDIVDERRLNYEGISFSNRILSDKDHDEAVILIIDNYGAFREKTDCAYDDILQELIKSGENYGVFTVITGSMIGSADIPARLFENIKSGICLRLNDRYQYSECLRRIHLPTMPKDLPGRGLACVNDRILEFQTYLCFTGDDMCRNEIIKSEVMSLNNNGMTKAAMKAPYIPHEPVVYDLDKALEGISLKPGQLPIGYDAVSARPFAPDVSKVSCIVFAGASGSGRSNACRVAGYYADKAGRRVIYADSIRSICDHIKENGNAMVICDGMEKAIDEFYRNDRDKDIGDEMADILSDPKEHILVFSFLSTAHTLVAGRKLYELIRSACLGIYLGGCLDRQNMFDFSYLSYSGQCKSRQPGNGTVLRRGNRIRSCDIVIPYADI